MPRLPQVLSHDSEGVADFAQAAMKGSYTGERLKRLVGSLAEQIVIPCSHQMWGLE